MEAAFVTNHFSSLPRITGTMHDVLPQFNKGYRNATCAAALALFAFVVTGCATHAARDLPDPEPAQLRDIPQSAVSLANRVTWGATAASVRQLQEQGAGRYLEVQLQAGVPEQLPAEVQARISALK